MVVHRPTPFSALILLFSNESFKIACTKSEKLKYTVAQSCKSSISCEIVHCILALIILWSASIVALITPFIRSADLFR